MPRPMEKLRDLGPQELVARERELTDQVFRLRFQMNTGQSEGLKKLRIARRDLARVKTLLREGQLNLQRPAVVPAARPLVQASTQAGAQSVKSRADGTETRAKTSAPAKDKPAKAKLKHAKAAKPKGSASKSTKHSAKPSTKSSAKPRTSHGK
jgi:large subunit ribosomal protein L29